MAIHEAVLGAFADTREVFPGGIDWAAFYLDDGTLAGTDAAVAHALNVLRTRLGDLGLEVNLSKCEAIPAAGRPSALPDGIFGNIPCNLDGDFKLPGALQAAPQEDREGRLSACRSGRPD